MLSRKMYQKEEKSHFSENDLDLISPNDSDYLYIIVGVLTPFNCSNIIHPSLQL